VTGWIAATGTVLSFEGIQAAQTKNCFAILMRLASLRMEEMIWNVYSFFFIWLNKEGRFISRFRPHTICMKMDIYVFVSFSNAITILSNFSAKESC
jgi:hypothetical protein